MDLRILGPLEIVQRGESISIPGHKARVLLACLIVNGGHAVSRDRLIDAIWGESPPDSAVNTLHTYVTHLRTALDGQRDGVSNSVISTHPNGYRLDLDEDAVDAWRFETAVAEARSLVDRRDFGTALEVLHGRLGEWRGPALEEFLDSEFAHQEALRLNDLRVSGEEIRATAMLETDQHESLVGILEPLVEDHPTRERLWEQLMLALYRSGRQADALRTYQRLSANLGEIGLDPGCGAADLEGRILEKDPSLLRHIEAAAAPKPSLLPRPVDPIVGRDRQLANLKSMLDDSRLVTVTGIGGVGKSRLALEAGYRWAAESGHPARYVDLTTVTEADVVSTRLGEAFGLGQLRDTNAVDQIADSIGDEALLLVVDNAEDATEAVGELIPSLVLRCPALRALVTSREPIHTGAGAVCVLGPMDTAAPFPSDAAKLFLYRARIDSSPSQVDIDAISSICSSVNGIPAAIEVVAAGTRMLSVHELAENLDELLRADDHRQDLTAVLEWTYGALPPEQQYLVRSMSVFPGGFTFEELNAVARPNTDDRALLTDLRDIVDRSLISVEPGLPSRYEMLEVFRKPVFIWLTESDEWPDVRSRFIQYFVDLAEDLESSFGTDRWQHSLERVDADEVNAAAGIDHALSISDIEAAYRMTGPLGRYWRWRGRPIEGLNRLLVVLEHNDVPPDLRAKAEREVAAVRRVTGDFEDSIESSRKALALYQEVGDRRGVADALYDLGLASIFAGDLDSARETLESSAEIWRDLGKPDLVVFPMIPLAWLRQIHGEYEAAEAMWTSILTNVDTSAFPEHSGITFRVAELALAQGQVERAEKIAAEALDAASRARYPYHQAGALVVLARIAEAAGDLEDAEAKAGAALDAAVESGNVEGAMRSLQILGRLACRIGDEATALRILFQFSMSASRIGGPLVRAALAELAAITQASRSRWDDAALLLGAADSLREKGALPLGALEGEDLAMLATNVEENLGSDDYQRLFQTGRDWDDRELVGFVGAWFA